MNITYDITSDTKDPDLKRHVRRTAVSVMANIAEGFGRYSSKDQKTFYLHARGSVLELQSHLYVLLDRKYLEKEAFDNAYNQTIAVSKLISGLIKSSLRLIKSSEQD